MDRSNGVTDTALTLHASQATVAGLASGMARMETDRDNVIYQVQSVAGLLKAWVYVHWHNGPSSFSNLPTRPRANDVNFTLLTSDTYEIYRWSGSARSIRRRSQRSSDCLRFVRH